VSHPEFWAGNLNPSITDIVKVDGVVQDLSTYSAARFKARRVGSKTLLVDQPVSNVLGVTGLVQYDWQAPDIAANGILDANLAADYQALVWWELTKSGRKQDVNEATITIRAHVPVALAYVELEEFKDTAQLTGTAFADQNIRSAILAASRAVDAETGRRFYLDTVDEDRYYTWEPPSGWYWDRYYDQWRGPAGRTFDHTLKIDDLVSLTSLTSSPSSVASFTDTWTLNTDFVLEPRSAPADGRPYTAIRCVPGATLPWPIWPESIKVTGKFGWPAVPENVKIATGLLAARLVKLQREAPFGIAGFGADGVAVRIGRSIPDWDTLLMGYARRRLFV
jgi:enamine deaminase RidA (YjgF/YER057c/UK114 family)